MYSIDDVRVMILELNERIAQMFPDGRPDALLFGSLARNEADEDSDIDILYLVDTPRDIIAEHNWQIGDAAAEMLLKYGVLISPIVENRACFNAYSQKLPFFRNVPKDGVRLNAKSHSY